MEYYFIYKTDYNYIGCELKPTDKPKIAYGIKILNKNYYDSLILANIIKCIYSGKDSLGNELYIISSSRDIQSIDSFRQNFALLGNGNLITFIEHKYMSGCIKKLIEAFEKTPEYSKFRALPKIAKPKTSKKNKTNAKTAKKASSKKASSKKAKVNMKSKAKTAKKTSIKKAKTLVKKARAKASPKKAKANASNKAKMTKKASVKK